MTHEPQLTEGETHGRRTDLLLDGRLVAWRFPGYDGVYEVCARCGGTGQYSYNPLDGTRCYGCNGSGRGTPTTEESILRRARNRAKAAARRNAKRAAETERRMAEAAGWRAAHPFLVDSLREYATDDDFLAELASRIEFQPLTDAQAQAADEAIGRAVRRRDQCQRQREAGHFGEVGKRVEVDVEIVFTKIIHTERFDRSDSVLVVMRTAEGQTLKTFSSGAFGWDAEKGQQLRIRGTVSEHAEYDGLPETMLKRVTAVG